MKNIILALLLLISATSFAQTYKVPEKMPNTFVHDYANILKPEQVASLNASIMRIKSESTIEIAIVVLPELTIPIEETALSIGRYWGIGNKNTNNGLLYVLAIKDRKTRLEVGPGLQGDLPDAVSNEIQDGLKRFYRSGDYYGGLTELMSSLQLRLSPQFTEQKKATESNVSPNTDVDAFINYGIGFVIFVVVVLVFFLINEHRQNKVNEEEAAKKLLSRKKELINIIRSSCNSDIKVLKDERLKYLRFLGRNTSNTSKTFYTYLDKMVKAADTKVDLNSPKSMDAMITAYNTAKTNASYANSALKAEHQEKETASLYIVHTLPKLPGMIAEAYSKVGKTTYKKSDIAAGEEYSRSKDRSVAFSKRLKMYVTLLNSIINYNKKPISYLKSSAAASKPRETKKTDNSVAEAVVAATILNAFIDHSSDDPRSSPSNWESSNNDSYDSGGGSFDGGGSSSDY